MTPWKNNSPNVQSFQSQQTMLHTPFGPIPNFPWVGIKPGQTPAVIGPTNPTKENVYGPFSQFPGLLKITSK